MEIYKNMSSGEYFIHIHDMGNDKKLFVTPKGEIKPLELRFFDEPNDSDQGVLLSDGSLTELQVKQYHAYIENRKKDEEFRQNERREEVERIIRVLKEMFPGLKEFSPDEKIMIVNEIKKLMRKRR